MQFLKPEILLLTPLALAGALMALMAWARQRQMINAWGNRENYYRFAKVISSRRYLFKGAALTLALAACLAALARPTVPDRQLRFPAGAVDVVVLLDVSRSMAARDCEGYSRINLARRIIREKLLPALNSNRIGVIVYSGEATAKVYLTYEIETTDWLAEHDLRISSAPGHGSAMGKAFELAFRFFDEDSEPSRKKMIVLFSDGGTDDDTNPDTIAKGCESRDVRLVIAGTGTTTPSLIPVEELGNYDRTTASGRFYKRGSEPARSALDARALSHLSQAGGKSATYLQATAPEHFKLEPLTARMGSYTAPGEKEMFFYPALAFYSLLCLASIATARHQRRASCDSRDEK